MKFSSLGLGVVFAAKQGAAFSTPSNIYVPQVRSSCHVQDSVVRPRGQSLYQSGEQETSSTQLYEATNEQAEGVCANNGEFSLSTALFCGGLAFDAYSEPPATSSRWERGSSGVDVAFQSTAFTRSIYKGLLQIEPIKCVDLPDEDDTAEGLMTGGGADGYLLVAVAEGKWKEDIKLIEKEKYNDGVLSLQGSAHVGRSSTAWSNVNKNKAMAEFKKGKGTGAYHVKSTWGKGGQAIWENDIPFYLYVQDPKEARLVFTVMDDDIVGDGSPIGSTSRRLKEILPAANIDDPLKYVKEEVLKKMKQGEEVDLNDSEALLQSIAQDWDGSMKLTSKPRIKDKKGQIAAAAAAGAMVAGPAGAAVGGLIGNFYEGEARGRVDVKVKYMPIPPGSSKGATYEVTGGLEGVKWGEMYEKHLQRVKDSSSEGEDPHLGGSDFEFCCFVTHASTGCSCAVYRSLEKKLIAVSFRGTCELIDLVTDASIIQESWVLGDEEAEEKVHIGFRKSMASISRRLKEVVLASVAPGDDIADYDLVVTGHSLGGSLSTLFTADVGEYGIDAGRGLPQLEPSEPWYSSLAANFMKNVEPSKATAPPRPKSLKMYNFGSPRVGNADFVANFDSLVGNGIDEAYRIVNGQDVVARLPRSVNALGVVKVGYEHCGPTVLISVPEEADDAQTLVWIEGKSEGDCPVRDGTALTSPLAKGSLLGDIVSEVNSSEGEGFGDSLSKLGSAMKGRFESFEASDIAGLVGIDKSFVEREANIIKSLASGEALSHHMEDQYYMAMGRSSGFIAEVGEDIRPMDNLSDSQKDEVQELVSGEDA
mmetsp:Transcript_6568/g.9390  ORF Transcript_6568/g.9390 Transcript_6568/m.9390 type:complete len:817 (+) Transcript_6568:70-2520(+)